MEGNTGKHRAAAQPEPTNKIWKRGEFSAHFAVSTFPLSAGLEMSFRSVQAMTSLTRKQSRIRRRTALRPTAESAGSNSHPVSRKPSQTIIRFLKLNEIKHLIPMYHAYKFFRRFPLLSSARPTPARREQPRGFAWRERVSCRRFIWLRLKRLRSIPIYFP